MNKIVSIDEALSHVKDGDTIMVGGFMANGSPYGLTQSWGVHHGASQFRQTGDERVDGVARVKEDAIWPKKRRCCSRRKPMTR